MSLRGKKCFFCPGTRVGSRVSWAWLLFRLKTVVKFISKTSKQPLFFSLLLSEKNFMALSPSSAFGSGDCHVFAQCLAQKGPRFGGCTEAMKKWSNSNQMPIYMTCTVNFHKNKKTLFCLRKFFVIRCNYLQGLN